MPIYVVFIGRKPGIYATWNQCAAQVDGFSGARHRKYSDGLKAANDWRQWTQRVANARQRCRSCTAPSCTYPACERLSG